MSLPVRLAVAVLVLLVVDSIAVLAWAAHGSARVIAVTGDPVPGGGGSLSFIDHPMLNDLGQVAFVGWTGVGLGGQGAPGIYLGESAGLTRIAIPGQAAPDGNGVFRSFSNLRLNAAGQVAFSAILNGTSGGGSDDGGIFLADQSTVRQIVREGQLAPDGNWGFSATQYNVLNDVGQVAFNSLLVGNTGGSANSRRVYRGDGLGLVEIVRDSQPSPDGDGLISGFTPAFGRSPIINQSGHVSFRALITSVTGSDDAILFGDGTGLELIARGGQAVPDGNGRFLRLTDPTLNDAGQVAFHASITNSINVLGDAGIFRGDGATIDELVRAGQAAPDGNGVFSTFGWQESFNASAEGIVPVFNNSGQFSFIAGLTETSGGATDDTGVFIAGGESLLQMVREGDSPPDVADSFAFFFNPRINEAGQVVFQSSTQDKNTGALGQGIYFFDESVGLTEVAHTGDEMLGSTIANLLQFLPGGGRGGGGYYPAELSKSGVPRIAYRFTLADGRTGIALWALVPEPSSLAIASLGAAAIAAVSWWPIRRRHR